MEPVTSTNIEPLIQDMLLWIDHTPRDYRQVMEYWRTSCPRLTVWEDAVDRGFVARHADQTVKVTAAGREFMRSAAR